MSTEATLGMNKRVPLETLQLAVEQELSGIDDFDRIDETIRAQFQGEARAVKGLKQVRSTVRNSPIHNFLMEHKDELLAAMKNKSDRNLILTAITSARFSFFYDVLSILGKQFRIQDDVNSDLLKRLIAVKYGSNKSVENKMYIAIPQMVEAELFARIKPGLYEFTEPQRPAHAITLAIWKESYYVNEPLVSREDEEYVFHPYFRFIKVDE